MLPQERAVVRQGRLVDDDVLQRARKLPQGGTVDLCDTRDEVDVAELDEVPDLLAGHGAAFEEWLVVPTAQEAVRTVEHTDCTSTVRIATVSSSKSLTTHPGCVVGRDVVHEPGDGLQCRDLRGIATGGRDSSREEPDAEGIDRTIVCLRAPDDVVREHALDVSACVEQDLREVVHAEQPLLFPRNGPEHDRRSGRRPLRHDAQKLEHRSDSRAIIIRAGRVVREVHDVRDARVIVASDDIYSVRVRRTMDPRNNVADVRRGRDAGCGCWM